jgi:hypothetical protein
MPHSLRRRHVLISALCFAVLALSIPLLSCSSDKSGGGSGIPVAYFPEERFNFGTIAQGERVTHQFKVQNTGDAPLEIIRAKGT